mgnify:FL=1
MADDIKIIKQDEELLFGDNGKLVEQVRVSFKVGDDGPFLQRFPKAGYSAGTVKMALEAFAHELRQVRQ